MHSKWLLFVLVIFISCSDQEKGSDVSETILSDFLQLNTNKELDEVIACAGSDRDFNSVSIFYFPEAGSFDFRYYETDDVNVNPDDFSNYKLKNLPINGVFGNKLSAFKREQQHEAWGIVTYQTNGKLHKSNSIRLKHLSELTDYNSNITIDNSTSLSPKFTWQASTGNTDAIYFQVLLEENDNFISGTYTFDQFFRYYDTSNVVLTINTNTPPELEVANNYQFIVLAVSLDNWVNSYSYTNFTAE
ncbi:hypothetical protein [uncultured Tenacibaculum sp.]|uniref:hypothetical protein n=1 Tax=uncultured Tenacibaculum sp. TaxID=174713 RepID=UPI0026050FFD|nr:hypothetical protein [uncultured Tenacibaculum sp.]